LNLKCDFDFLFSSLRFQIQLVPLHLERCMGKGRVAARNPAAGRPSSAAGFGAMAGLGTMGLPQRALLSPKKGAIKGRGGKKPKAKSLAALAAETPSVMLGGLGGMDAMRDDVPLYAMLAQSGLGGGGGATTPATAKGKKAVAAAAAAAAAAAGGVGGTPGSGDKGGVVRKPRSGLLKGKKGAGSLGGGAAGRVSTPLSDGSKGAGAKGKCGKKTAAGAGARGGSLLPNDNFFAGGMEIPFDDSTFDIAGGFGGAAQVESSLPIA
jgi:hypothetical protein